MNLPEVLFQRILALINENGDEQVDHDEWLKFFLQLTCGSFEHRLLIVFKIFDITKTQVLRAEQIKMLLAHVPLYEHSQRYGKSFPFACRESQTTVVELVEQRIADQAEISKFVDTLFDDSMGGLVFEDFKQLTLYHSSDMFFSFYNLVQERIPCYRHFLRARANHIKIFQTNTMSNPDKFKCFVSMRDIVGNQEESIQKSVIANLDLKKSVHHYKKDTKFQDNIVDQSNIYKSSSARKLQELKQKLKKMSDRCIFRVSEQQDSISSPAFNITTNQSGYSPIKHHGNSMEEVSETESKPSVSIGGDGDYSIVYCKVPYRIDSN